ncbi:MAG: hypothetical protein ACO3B0_09790, partial [Chitinophagaceae bacterium]
TNSWYRTYIDEKTPFVLNNQSKVYTYKKDYNTPEKRTAAETELDGILKEGDVVKVKLIGIDHKTGKFKLSRKVLIPKPEFKKPEDEQSSEQ